VITESFSFPTLRTIPHFKKPEEVAQYSP